MSEIRKSKFDAFRVPCPKCGANESRRCVGKGGKTRKAFHVERHIKASARTPAKMTSAKGYGRDWALIRARVFAEKGCQCVYCGSDASHVDHKTPKARGGTDDMSNLVPCCQACNIAKSTMTVEEWRG